MTYHPVGFLLWNPQCVRVAKRHNPYNTTAFNSREATVHHVQDHPRPRHCGICLGFRSSSQVCLLALCLGDTIRAQFDRVTNIISLVLGSFPFPFSRLFCDVFERGADVICQCLSKKTCLTIFNLFHTWSLCRPIVSRTLVRAEPEPDYEAEFNKLQKEAEERIDDKVEELMKNIETVGQKK